MDMVPTLEVDRDWATGHSLHPWDPMGAPSPGVVSGEMEPGPQG